MTTKSLEDLLAFAPPTTDAAGWETAEAQAFRFPQRYLAKCQEFNDYARGLAALEREKDHLFDFVVRNLISAMDTVQFVAGELGLPLGHPSPCEAVATTPEADDALQDVEGVDSQIVDGQDVDTEPATDDSRDEEPSAEATGEEDAPAPLEPAARHEAAEPTADTPPATAAAAQADAELLHDVAISRRGIESIQRSLLNLLEGLHVYPVDLLGKTYRGVEVNGRLVNDPFEVVEAQNQGKGSELPVLEVVTGLWVQTEPGLRVVRKGQVIC